MGEILFLISAWFAATVIGLCVFLAVIPDGLWPSSSPSLGRTPSAEFAELQPLE